LHIPSRVDGPSTTEAAATTTCPYREHALTSHQEHEAWDVLLACQGQLRLAPSGQVIGIDMDAALQLGAARGYRLAVLSELLPAAEAGLIEALSTSEVRVMSHDRLIEARSRLSSCQPRSVPDSPMASIVCIHGNLIWADRL
jgi:hypothetical protein